MRGDDDLIREAISNLVDNAIKFTPPRRRRAHRGGVGRGTALRRSQRHRARRGAGGARKDLPPFLSRRHRSAARAATALVSPSPQTIARLHGFELTVEDDHPGARFVMRAAAKASLAIGHGLSAAARDHDCGATPVSRCCHWFRRAQLAKNSKYYLVVPARYLTLFIELRHAAVRARGARAAFARPCRSVSPVKPHARHRPHRAQSALHLRRDGDADRHLRRRRLAAHAGRHLPQYRHSRRRRGMDLRRPARRRHVEARDLLLRTHA